MPIISATRGVVLGVLLEFSGDHPRLPSGLSGPGGSSLGFCLEFVVRSCGLCSSSEQLVPEIHVFVVAGERRARETERESLEMEAAERRDKRK